MRINIITLFPEMFEGPFSASIVRRAVERGLVGISVRQLRDFTHDRHRTVDDEPYGGGPGMVMMAPPLFEAVESVRAESEAAADGTPHVVLMSPQGAPLTQGKAIELAGRGSLTIVCGHYEGVDERFVEHGLDEQISIGDYVLTGGELPAMVLVDAVVRLLPGVLGDPGSAERDTFSPAAEGILQGPSYTRPAEYRGWKIPDVLLSGDHAKVAEWRRRMALERTRERRPDLLDEWPLDRPERP